MKEYDLVIVGGGALGFDTARRAAAYHGRVALVTQGVGFDPRPLQRAAWLNAWRWKEAGKDWAETPQLAAEAIAQQQALYYNADSLAALGIEVIEGLGRFGRKPHLTLDLESGRKLRSRRYLLALPPQRGVVEPLEWQLDQPLPDRLVVFEDWEMAMALGRLGRSLTFVTDDWLGLDRTVAAWVQVQLEAMDVEVWLTNGEMGKAWLEDLDCYLQVDCPEPPDYSGLNLPAQWSPVTGLRRDRLARTTHRQIYAIDHPGEIPTLLRNTLLDSNNPLPLWNQTHHNEVAQWGCAQVPKGAFLLRQEFSTLAIAQLHKRPEGFCQLIMQPNGKVIGAQITGSRAGELLAIVVANPRIETLEQCSEGWAAILGILAQEFWRLRSEKGWRRDLLESYFAWTRPWR
jgi:pyruvate/2-oxoglutarate dehydrogenase complex dihydrolipoamide dehydrogenase (E3) component